MKSKEERKKDKQKKRNKWQMNRELYLCSLLMLAVFAGMIWYLADYVSSNQEALFNNSYNSQQRVLAQEYPRNDLRWDGRGVGTDCDRRGWNIGSGVSL